MTNQETIILYFSIKNGVKNNNYQLEIKFEEKTSGKYQEFKTDIIKWAENQTEMCFKKSIELDFIFDKKQKFKILYICKEKNQITRTEEIKTVLSSIVCCDDSIYKKPFNKKFPSKELLCIKIIKDNKYNNKVSPVNTIFDFINSGMRLSTFIAIDCSNGKNKKSLSESYINYKRITLQILNRILPFNKDNQYYIFGYGAKLKNAINSEILYKSVFNMNMKSKNSSIHYKEVIEEYKKCFNNIISDNKVYLSSLIRKITKEIYNSYDLRYYNVLFILSRELTAEEDNQETIDVFVESGYLPLTIIIICEGKNDTNKMKNLFGSRIEQSSHKMSKIRNNIICISFSDDFNENEDKMIENCLREINQHIIEYFKLNKCTPLEIEKKNRNQNIEKRINQYKDSIWLYESRLSVIKKEEEVDNNCNNIPNFNKIYNDSKMMSKEPEKKPINKKETPKGTPDFVLPEDTSINGNMNNPYSRNKNTIEKPNKETPKGFLLPGSDSINSNINNPFGNTGKVKNNYIDNNSIYHNNRNNNNNQEGNINKYNQVNQNSKPNEKEFKITPGNSINPKIKDNPYKKDVEPQQFRITPEDSINPKINYNPYSKNRETPHGPDNYFIPNKSISHDRGNLINPYNKKSKNSNNYDEKQINNIDSRLNENISTNNSNNDENLKLSNLVRITNYDRDKI